MCRLIFAAMGNVGVNSQDRPYVCGLVLRRVLPRGEISSESVR